MGQSLDMDFTPPDFKDQKKYNMNKLRGRILAFFDPSRSIPLFIVGTAALSLVLQAFYDLANDPETWQGGYWLALGALGLVAVILIATWFRRPVTGQVHIREEEKPTPHRGLILLVSPNPTAAATASIEYHLPVLQHCWLIASAESLAMAQTLANEFRGHVTQVYFGAPHYLVEPEQIQSTYAVMQTILEDARKAWLADTDLIADITGGQKPMTVGLALACSARNVQMQYMKIQRTPVGEAQTDIRPMAIRIDANFVPGEGQNSHST